MKTIIPGKDAALEDTIEIMTGKLKDLGINIEISSWLNPIAHVWSVHIRDADSPMCFTNGKGASKNAALASALGEYFERISCNYFYADWYFGEKISKSSFVHYSNEKWFPVDGENWPENLLDENLLAHYGADGELKTHHLVDTNSGQKNRGVCALPFVRQSDQKEVFIPVNIIGNLFVSNGMSAGNTKFEARVQCLSEIFERYTKNKIIMEEIALPDIPMSVLNRYPQILEGIKELEAEGFPVIIKDASLGGQFPVINVTLMNPKNSGVFASFGAHPRFEVALERTLTELLQGRRLDSLDVVQSPTFNEYTVCNHDNIEDHFIDSTGVISWKFFNAKRDYEFCDWDFSGSTEQEYNHLMGIFQSLEKEVYIADYNHLNVNACRILVPGMSEIYLPEDLIWDNNNRGLLFREDILNLHSLRGEELEDLLDNLDESELDDFMPISELIGVVFDAGTAWSELRIGELKLMIHLALGNIEASKAYTQAYLSFAEASATRMTFYRALDVLLDIELDENLIREDYALNMSKLFGEEIYKAACDHLDNKAKFWGLTVIGNELAGLKTHGKLLESFEKLRARM